MQAGQAAPQRPSLAQTAISPLARAYQAYQQYVGEPFQQIVRGGVRGYFGLPVMTDASSLGREAHRQGEALGFAPGVGMPAGAVRMAAEGMQALPSIAGDISRVIGGLPSAAAARQAEDFAAYQRSIPPSDVSPLTAFHGTPHTFAPEPGAPMGRFRAEKIGSGEGAQAYGHGLYFAESAGVAKQYKSNLSRGSYFDAASGENVDSGLILQRAAQAVQSTGVSNVQRPQNANQIANQIMDWVDKGRVARSFLLNHIVPKELEPAYEAAINEFQNLRPVKGSLYTVDIPDAMVDKMLDWDKPLSEQPKAVQNALNKLPQDIKDYIGIGKYEDLLGGTDILKPLGGLIGDAKASELLRQSGIPGIRYLDEGSRTAGEGTRNIVVFPGEEQNVKILSRE